MPGDSTLKPISAEAPSVVWEQIGAGLWGLAAGGAVLLIEDSHLALRRAETGDLLWERDAAGPPEELAPCAEGILLSSGRVVWEVDLLTGEERWRQTLPDAPATLASGRRAAFLSAGRWLYAIEHSSGATLWRTRCGADADLHPLALDPRPDLLVVSDPETEAVRALDALSGRKRWEFHAEGAPVVVGAGAQGVLAVSCHSQGVTGVQCATGKVAWRYAPGGVFEAPAVRAGENLVVTDGAVHALAAATGEVVWRREPPGPSDGFYLLRSGSGGVLAETWRGRLLLLERDTGMAVWDIAPGQVHGVAWGENRLFLRLSTTRTEYPWSLLACETASGEIAWELRSQEAVTDLTWLDPVLVVERKDGISVLSGV